MSNVRTRFAPSPTGYLHVGGARTALFNWLFARKMGGEFIMRVEDTDQKRSTPEAVQAIFDGMTWLGLDYDEGPGKEKGDTKYFQTQRTDLYNGYAQQLLDAGLAYKCYRTAEELQVLRAEAEARGLKGYQREWADLPDHKRRILESSGAPYVIRFKAPTEGKIVVDDIVHGQVTFNISDMVDDFVMIKNDGIPTYNYACVIDDATMGMTHVLRGDDHLANTPKQIAIYQALGLAMPKFGHLPMILGPDKSKLSKRHGATSVIEYDAMGFLPWAMVNYLARLGWSHGDQEIFSRDELIAAFDLEGLGKTAAVFDMKKFTWLNAHWLREAGTENLLHAGRLLERIPGHERMDLTKANDHAWLSDLVEQLKPRSETLNDMANKMGTFFPGDVILDEKASAKFLTEDGLKLLDAFGSVLENSPATTAENLNLLVNDFAEKQGIKAGAIAQPLRVALTGNTVSPGIGETLALIGKDESLRRIRQVTKSLQPVNA